MMNFPITREKAASHQLWYYSSVLILHWFEDKISVQFLDVFKDLRF